MQPIKKYLSYLSGLLIALGGGIAAINGFFTSTGITEPPMLAKILVGAGALILTVRNVINDFAGSSDPVVAAGAQAGAVAGAQAAQKVVASQ